MDPKNINQSINSWTDRFHRRSDLMLIDRFHLLEGDIFRTADWNIIRFLTTTKSVLSVKYDCFYNFDLVWSESRLPKVPEPPDPQHSFVVCVALLLAGIEVQNVIGATFEGVWCYLRRYFKHIVRTQETLAGIKACRSLPGPQKTTRSSACNSS